MPLKDQILDGTGQGHLARVGAHNQLYTAQVFPELPELGTKNRYRYFSQVLGSEGFGSGTINQRVDGSATPQRFYGGAHVDYDIHIMGIAILIADTAVVHNQFGTVAVLGTGWDLYVSEEGEDTFLVEKAKTGGQVIAQAGFRGGAGAGSNDATWELLNWTGNNDAQYIYFPISDYLPGGFRIGRGSKNRITSVVNDDITGLTEFWQRCFGYRHYA